MVLGLGIQVGLTFLLQCKALFSAVQSFVYCIAMFFLLQCKVSFVALRSFTVHDLSGNVGLFALSVFSVCGGRGHPGVEGRG